MTSTAKVRRWLHHRRIAFDTSFLIPLLENLQKGLFSYSRIFNLLSRKRIAVTTSTVTLLEILVHPYRHENLELVNLYYGYLTREELVTLLPVSFEVANRAARLRAQYGFKTPDAIQIATALEGGSTLLLSQDRHFRKQKEIEIDWL